MSQPATGGISTDDRQKIDALSSRFVELMLAGDAEGLSQSYSPDAVLMPPNHPSVHGRGAIREFLSRFPKVTRFSARNEEVDGRGDIAYVRGTYSMTVEPEAGVSVEDEGKYLEVRKRGSDGSWPIALDMFSSDKEPA
jgi:ketosteroid isomerase-like protein